LLSVTDRAEGDLQLVAIELRSFSLIFFFRPTFTADLTIGGCSVSTVELSVSGGRVFFTFLSDFDFPVPEIKLGRRCLLFVFDLFDLAVLLVDESELRRFCLLSATDFAEGDLSLLAIE
jgi:hypothetical protein